MEQLLVTLLIGAAAGWLGSVIYKGSGLGVLGNIVVGIIGSVVGTWILGQLNVHIGTGYTEDILKGALGAIVILVLINLFYRRRV